MENINFYIQELNLEIVDEILRNLTEFKTFPLAEGEFKDGNYEFRFWAKEVP